MKLFFSLKQFGFTCLILASFLLFDARSELAEGQYSPKAQRVEDANPYKDLNPRLQNLQQEKWIFDNGLSLLLVHDPEAPQSGVGLFVPVGSADDLLYARGTAHFTEHMLAGRSNEQFKDGFNEFILGQGGIYNASTYLGFTTYRIALGNDLFTPITQRLFAMLDKPLFIAEEVKAELTAVDEEFRIHSMRDGVRIWSGVLSQLNDNCPLKGYHCGNKETLSSLEASSMKGWFEQHYTSKGSTCVILSAKPLEEMREIILPLAEKVPVRAGWERQKKHYKQQESKFIFVETLQGTNCLLFCWPYTSQPLNEKQQDLYLLTSLINSEAPNGLSSTLKQLGFASQCESSIEQLGEGLPNLFLIEVKLTDFGVEHWKEVGSYIEAFLEQAALISKKQSHRIINELRQSQILSYQYRGKKDPFSFVSSNVIALAKEPLSTFPFYSIASQSFNWKDYKTASKNLILNHKIVLLASEYSKWEKAQDNFPEKPASSSLLQEMPFWGYKFFSTSVPQFKKINTKFLFPEKQRFLPKDTPSPYFIEVDQVVHAIFPEVHFGFHSGPLYVIQDHYFGIPKDHLLVRLKHPLFFQKNPNWHLMAETWWRIVNKELEALSYEAHLSGNGLIVGQKSPYSLNLSVFSWESESELLLKEALLLLKKTKVTEEKINRVLEEMRLEIQEVELSPPFQTARRLFLEHIQEAVPTIEERKEFLSSVSLKDMQSFNDFFLQTASFEAVYLGQKNQEKLDPLLFLLEGVFNANYSKEMNIELFHPGLEPGLKDFHFFSPLPGHAARLSVDCGSTLSPQNFVCSWILSTGMDPIAMNQLREKEELGYVVRCGLQEAHGRLFFTTLTQSTKVNCSFLMERYRRLFQDTLQGLGQEPFFQLDKFEALRTACLEFLKAPEGSPLSLLNKVSSLAFERSKNWQFEQEAIKAVQTLTFNDFKDFCQRVLDEKSSCQLLIAVEGSLQNS